MSKAQYVVDEAKRSRITGHHCHWPGCTKQVPPAMWGCRDHWYSLPKSLRDKIWRTFDPGQEITKTPSPEYIAAAREAQEWIAANARDQATTDLFEQHPEMR